MEDKVVGLFKDMDISIETFTGRRFYLLHPEDSDIQLVDIAHALSQICRFAGHSSHFYSVAEHSVRVAAIVPKEIKLAALLHDAAEAYMGDISRPLKTILRDRMDFDAIENRIQAAIDDHLRVDPVADVRVRWADNVLLRTEGLDLMNNSDEWHWPVGLHPLKERIIPWTADEAMVRFLCSYDALKQE